MNTFTQIFATITMLLLAIQKFIHSFDDAASMLNQTTSTALAEQTVINKDRLSKLNAAIAANEFDHELDDMVAENIGDPSAEAQADANK